MKSTPHAFTLTELLVTITLIAILASIGFYGYRELIPHSRSVACRQHLYDLGRALQLYLSEHQEIMPSLAAGRSSLNDGDKPTLDTVLRPYLDDPGSLRCPADEKGLHETTGTSYFWNSLLNGQRSSNLRFLLTQDQSLIPMISDKEAFHKGIGTGVNILYADGRVDGKFTLQVGQ